MAKIAAFNKRLVNLWSQGVWWSWVDKKTNRISMEITKSFGKSWKYVILFIRYRVRWKGFTSFEALSRGFATQISEIIANVEKFIAISTGLKELKICDKKETKVESSVKISMFVWLSSVLFLCSIQLKSWNICKPNRFLFTISLIIKIFLPAISMKF